MKKNDKIKIVNKVRRDKIAGSVFGFAIGDAMGATTEFMKKEDIAKVYGRVEDIIGGGWLKVNPGEVTDDTEMTMCIIRAFVEEHDDMANFEIKCKENFIKWYLNEPKDIGDQCLKRIMQIINYGLHDKNPVCNDALGNGSLMRAMPMAVLGLENYNVVQGAITHNNKECERIIRGYTKLIQAYINNEISSYNHPSFRSRMEPSGHILNTVNNSIIWSNKDSFEEAVVSAVNDGGDADTIAAITGSIAGARFGYRNIPERWINTLDKSVYNELTSFINFVFNYLHI